MLETGENCRISDSGNAEAEEFAEEERYSPKKDLDLDEAVRRDEAGDSICLILQNKNTA